jgi:hypothetical protein
MTREAGGRPLQARLAPTGQPSARHSSTNGKTSKDGRATSRHDATNGHPGGTDGNGTHATGTDATGRARAKQKPAPTTLIQHDPLAALVDEAQAAVSEGANALRSIRERYRSGYAGRVQQWERLRTDASGERPSRRADNEQAMVGREVNIERSTLARIDLAVKSLENAWLFLAREDTSLVSDQSGPPSAADAQMRIVEAQEAERTRLAR